MSILYIFNIFRRSFFSPKYEHQISWSSEDLQD